MQLFEKMSAFWRKMLREQLVTHWTHALRKTHEPKLTYPQQRLMNKSKRINRTITICARRRTDFSPKAKFGCIFYVFFWIGSRVGTTTNAWSGDGRMGWGIDGGRTRFVLARRNRMLVRTFRFARTVPRPLSPSCNLLDGRSQQRRAFQDIYAQVTGKCRTTIYPRASPWDKSKIGSCGCVKKKRCIPSTSDGPDSRSDVDATEVWQHTTISKWRTQQMANGGFEKIVK